jgi:hypothetical protein
LVRSPRATKEPDLRVIYQFPNVPAVILHGEVVEAAPPRKLVQTWRMLIDPEMAAEGFTHLTYEIEEARGGVTKLTVTHYLTGAPTLAASLRASVSREASAAAGTKSSAVSKRCLRPEFRCRCKAVPVGVRGAADALRRRKGLRSCEKVLSRRANASFDETSSAWGMTVFWPFRQLAVE